MLWGKVVILPPFFSSVFRREITMSETYQWRSVARILARAQIVIPGHGPAFEVTPQLLRDLIAAFPAARHARQCPDVLEALRVRLASLEGD
jgi:glyoxylase-like metal-dependent hydrolase (beta-lactamase superfamily II)